jgi:hypothetical protein
MTPPKTDRLKRQRATKAIVFTDRESQLVEAIIDRVLEKLGELLSDLGIANGAAHAQVHKDLELIMPWIRAKVTAEQKRAQFWSKLEEIGAHVMDKVIKDSAILLMKGALIFGVMSVIYGYRGAIAHFFDGLRLVIPG